MEKFPRRWAIQAINSADRETASDTTIQRYISDRMERPEFKTVHRITNQLIADDEIVVVNDNHGERWYQTL